MTSRPRFGDFAGPARQHLAAAAPRAPHGWQPSNARAAAETGAFVTAAGPVLRAIGRYLADITDATGAWSVSHPRDHRAAARHHAAEQALHAWQNACRSLPPARQQPPARTEPGAAARHLQAAATAMITGRDLLHTHLATDINGAVRYRSGWAPVLTSPQASRALLAEIAGWSRQLAGHAAALNAARPPHAPPEPAQRSAQAISRSLSAVAAILDQARLADPVTATDTGSLHAIPLNTEPPRRRPAATATITTLSQGTSDCAERLHTAAATEPPAPGISAESMRHSAALSAAISHHTQIIARTLADRARQAGDTRLARSLENSARAAAARQAWLTAASAWSGLQTPATGITPVAAETADLAQWTGRLAYASPAWTMRTGRAGTPRPPGQLAPQPRDIAPIAGILTRTAFTLTALAAADYTQLRAATRTGQLLIPLACTQPDGQTATRHVPAPAGHATTLLAAYRDAGLTATRAAAAAARTSHHAGAAPRSTPRPPAPRPKPRPAPSPLAAALREPPENPPGPVETILRELGPGPELLAQARAIDDTTRQLITRAIARTEPQRWDAAVTKLNAIADTRQIIHHVLTPAIALQPKHELPAPPPARRAPPGHPPPGREDPEAGQ